jgi:hypothetical protein
MYPFKWAICRCFIALTAHDVAAHQRCLIPLIFLNIIVRIPIDDKEKIAKRDCRLGIGGQG